MKLNITNIKKIARETLKDPKKEIPYQVLADMEDPTYLLLKTQENITRVNTDTTLSVKERDILIDQSINLLVYAKTLTEI